MDYDIQNRGRSQFYQSRTGSLNHNGSSGPYSPTNDNWHTNQNIDVSPRQHQGI